MFNEVVHSEYTAAFGDALVGSKRLQLANEGAVKTNIQDIISKLVALSRTLPAGAAGQVSVGGM